MVTHRVDANAQLSGGDGITPFAYTPENSKVEGNESREQSSHAGDSHSKQTSTSGVSSTPDDGLSGGRTCRGCLYFSKSLKQQGSQAPVCMGVSKLESFPDGVTVRRGPSTSGKHLKTLESEFKYACVGYSLYSESSLETDSDAAPTSLPLCSGIEFLVDRRQNDASNSSASPSEQQQKRDPLQQKPDPDPDLVREHVDHTRKLEEAQKLSERLQEVSRRIEEAQEQQAAQPSKRPSQEPEQKKQPKDFSGRFFHAAEIIGARCYSNGVVIAGTATAVVHKMIFADRGRR